MELLLADVEEVQIFSIGNCMLLRLDQLPVQLRSYVHLYKSACLLGLREVGPVSQAQIQDIFHKVTKHLVGREAGSLNSTIWISGRHDAYEGIDPKSEEQELESCITTMQLCWYGGALRVEMNLWEFPVYKVRKLGPKNDIVLALFRAPEPLPKIVGFPK